MALGKFCRVFNSQSPSILFWPTLMLLLTSMTMMKLSKEELEIKTRALREESFAKTISFVRLLGDLTSMVSTPKTALTATSQNGYRRIKSGRQSTSKIRTNSKKLSLRLRQVLQANPASTTLTSPIISNNSLSTS